MTEHHRAYLGDSVYVELTPAREIKLTTNNGYPDDPRNTIYLEPEVARELTEWLRENGICTKGPGDITRAYNTLVREVLQISSEMTRSGREATFGLRLYESVVGVAAVAAAPPSGTPNKEKP